MLLIEGSVKVLPISIGAEGGTLQTGQEAQSVVMLNLQTQCGNLEVVIPPEHVQSVADALLKAKEEADSAPKGDLVISGSMQEAKAVADTVDKFK